MGSAVRRWMHFDDRSGWGVSIGILLATGLALACKPRAARSETPEPSGASAVDDATSDDAVNGGITDAPTSEEPECGAEGSPWDGSPGCMYEHGGCCYPDPASVCAAAGCTDDNCTIMESQPAGASC